ncbi:hypothetical protein [Flavobacterium aquidurense]|uniref:Uncharacterized protein n=1 Tax=Flavobacterium aquidurense TaxID=362413 RepID=A0A0N8VNM9_9FLAO|nr:hypothetical protein [Flavobacterium aquidurense]KQB42572.1 hypothetical protein RC62_3579 [Flavobacterium aquidurense]
MNELDKKSWYSGDWTPINNLQVPYNGLIISATPNYGPSTSPPTPQKLTAILIDVVDYTYDPNGVSSQLTLTKGGWNDIPIPEDNSVSPPQPNFKFTVSGTGNSDYGQIQLTTTSQGIYLNIQFCYGPENKKREELGFIMKFLETYTPGGDIETIEVEC